MPSHSEINISWFISHFTDEETEAPILGFVPDFWPLNGWVEPRSSHFKSSLSSLSLTPCSITFYFWKKREGLWERLWMNMRMNIYRTPTWIQDRKNKKFYQIMGLPWSLWGCGYFTSEEFRFVVHSFLVRHYGWLYLWTNKYGNAKETTSFTLWVTLPPTP